MSYLQNLETYMTGGGGALVFEVVYHPHKKKKRIVIRVVFRTRQCTCVHRLGVQKRAKLEKKKHCFLVHTKQVFRVYFHT